MHASYVVRMATIQVRNVPEELSRALKAKAALEGKSLSEFLLGELQQVADRPTRQELLERIARRGVAELTPAAEVLAEQRPAG